MDDLQRWYEMVMGPLLPGDSFALTAAEPPRDSFSLLITPDLKPLRGWTQEPNGLYLSDAAREEIRKEKERVAALRRVEFKDLVTGKVRRLVRFYGSTVPELAHLSAGFYYVEPVKQTPPRGLELCFSDLEGNWICNFGHTAFHVAYMDGVFRVVSMLDALAEAARG